jgi:hypothetical protein
MSERQPHWRDVTKNQSFNLKKKEFSCLSCRGGDVWSSRCVLPVDISKEFFDSQVTVWFGSPPGPPSPRSPLLQTILFYLRILEKNQNT